MQFLQNLSESRMTKNAKDQPILTYSDCCEKLYLLLLTIEFMRNYAVAYPFVKKYCRDTQHGNYKHFKISGTDAYNFIHFILGDETTLRKLKDPEAAANKQASTNFSPRDIVSYLRSVATGNIPTSATQMFIRLENGFDIVNPEYKKIRRALQNFNRASERDKTTVATKLLYALRAKCRNSDVIDDFSKLVARKDLENSRVVDNEPTVTTPDTSRTTSRDLIHYKLLADPSNLVLIKSFLEQARSGRSIPSNMVKAYLPIIDMIDEIVVAGPAYINLLKSVSKRAKKQI